MPRYLISFDDGSMEPHPDRGLACGRRGVARSRQEAKDAGVWIFGGGVERQQASAGHG